MKIKRVAGCVGIILGLATFSAKAEDLLDVYRQALISDPTYQEAYATWQANQQNFPIAVAQLLPQLDLTGTLESARSKTGQAAWSSSKTKEYQLTLTQPLINFANWFAAAEANDSVKVATVTYAAGGQDLMLRTAQAYFNVLKAGAQLRYTLAEEEALKKQLETAREKFKVGLIAITAVYQAQAQYDATVATEINDRNNLESNLENLTAVTGVSYQKLKGVGNSIPLLTPFPRDIKAWVDQAEKENLDLKAQEYTVMQAQENLRQQFSGHLPTVDLTGSYNDTGTENSLSIWQHTKTKAIGVSANLPLLAGGEVVFETLQARHQYEAAVAQRELKHRIAVNNTRKNYLGIVANISQIKADEQAVISASKALRATQAGYVVGTETMQTVLTNLSDLYQAQRQYTADQYDYLLGIINLKKAAGSLSLNDLAEINGWLGKEVEFTPRSTTGNELGTIVAPPASLNGLEENDDEGANANDQAASLVSPASSPPTADQKTAAAPSISSGAPAAYTIQLYAAKDTKSAQQFIRQLRAKYPATKKQLQVFPVTVQGKQWYKVGYGHFDNASAANKKLHLLSKKFKSFHPWIASV